MASEQTDEASPLVWWIAQLMLAAFEGAISERVIPEYAQVGDWGIEVTHLLGMPKRDGLGYGLTRAVGKVIDRHGGDYLIETLDGTRTGWENAIFYKLPTTEGRDGVENCKRRVANPRRAGRETARRDQS